MSALESASGSTSAPASASTPAPLFRRIPRPVPQEPYNAIVFHPGYEAPLPILTLPCSDRTRDGIPGISGRVLHWACAIIANNAWDGFLSRSSIEGPPEPTEDMYPMDSYYFHVPSATGDNTPYPIVPSFAAWTMPDGFRLPRPVAQPSTIHESIRVWDQIMVRGTTEEGRSIATGLDFGCHACHLVPAAQHNWFEYHKMLKYAQSPTSTISDPTSHPENLVTLDANLHEHFDIAGFVLIPAPGPGDEWSIYSLMAKTDFTACFHGALVDFHAPPRATASAFLFARFAWAVLHLAKPHLSRPKLVKVRVSIQTMPSESSTSPPSTGDKRTRSSSATSTFTQAPSSSANPSMAAGTSLKNLNAFAPHRFAFPWSQTTVAGVPVITADEDNVSAPP